MSDFITIFIVCSYFVQPLKQHPHEASNVVKYIYNI